MSERSAIDFRALAAALLTIIDSLVAEWLPHGFERNGRWYVGDWDGGAGESAYVDLSSGLWIDHAGDDDDKGGDLISLYARIQGLNNFQAAKRLMELYRLGRVASTEPPRRARPAPAEDRAPVEEPEHELPAPAPSPRSGRWKPIVPVPKYAPPPKFTWRFHDKVMDVWHELVAVRSWAYEFEGELFGHVARFERVNSKGETVKDTLPFTWCTDTTDPRGSQRWAHKGWDTPRPLYVPASILSGEPDRVPVVIVEGEKCAMAGHELLSHEFDFVSWPGGARAWSQANWQWLMGRRVILWPDSDAQRERLTKAEREAGVDPATKPVKPIERQPGMQAMVGIGSLLVAEHGCEVSIVHLMPPGRRPDGWDIADAIADGWDADRVRTFLRSATRFVAPDDAARAKAAAGRSTPSRAAAGDGEAVEVDADAWRDSLLKSGTGAIRPVRENAVLALDGLPGHDIPGAAGAAGVVAFNEFTNDVIKLQATPWRTPAGVWEEVDDLMMGEWLVREHWLPSMPRGTLEEAVRMVAYRHKYHPVRQWLQGLKWDGTPRLSTWLRRVCLEEDEWDDEDPLQRYLSLVGTFYLGAMVRRVMLPGCKFDYMLILEGEQGMRKSTLLRTLAGEYFADTGLVFGDKDSYQQLQGVWLYEVGELDAFSKADVKMIKAYVASSEDYFRASFDRRARKYPRQVVFGGTTNEDHYLTDPTGNRRFWPVRVTRTVDIEWLEENRAQLFAEAVDYVSKGGRVWPTLQEERELFMPQQESRVVDNAIGSAIGRYLYPADTDPNGDGLLVTEISLVDLLGKIGIGVEKLGPGRFHEKQAGAALRRLGWTERRSSAPGRPRVFCRPRGRSVATSSAQHAAAVPAGADDDCPF